MNSIKCYLFDLDGTLLKTAEDLMAALNFMRKSFNLPPLALEKVINLLGNGIRDLIRQSFIDSGELPVTEELVDQAFKINMEYYQAHLADLTCPYPGVVEVLEELRARQVKMAVVTNKHSSAARKILTAVKLDKYFDLVAGDGENIPLKPAPDLLLHAVEKLGCCVEDTLMVGDNHTDLGAARRAGIKSVFITGGYGVADGEKPDFTINSFEELRNIKL